MPLIIGQPANGSGGGYEPGPPPPEYYTTDEDVLKKWSEGQLRIIAHEKKELRNKAEYIKGLLELDNINPKNWFAGMGVSGIVGTFIAVGILVTLLIMAFTGKGQLIKMK